MKAAPATRSGWKAARMSDQLAPREREIKTASSTPTASITATASWANSSGSYAAPPFGASERPLPRPSNVTTRKWRLR
jgi:hypothetical protein